ncbi:MAG: polysaccharide pyruvyl transferase CsaB [Firmicutes bacterium]|nr:polysaccharide pyruvyl transferase CsaB [Candidatus Fermentithermobacillaceae bacterium]
MQKVVLAGYYGMHNTGDEAILAATVSVLRHARDDLRLVVLSADPQGTASAYGLEAFHRMSPLGVFKALHDADLVLFGGGSLLQDVTSKRSLLYYLAVLKLARFLARRVMIYANGVGPVRWPTGRKMVADAVSRADIITVRDEDSAAELRAMGVVGREIHVTADPVFLLKPGPREVALAALRSHGLLGANNILWLSLRPASGETWTLSVIDLILSARNRGLEPVFFLMQESSDGREASRVNELLRTSGQPPVPVMKASRPEDALALISEGRFLIGMRLHSLILAAMGGVPAAGVELDPKITSFLKAAGLVPAPAPSAVRPGDLPAVLEDLISKEENIRRSLEAKLPEFRSRAWRNLDLALSLLPR